MRVCHLCPMHAWSTLCVVCDDNADTHLVTDKGAQISIALCRSGAVGAYIYTRVTATSSSLTASLCDHYFAVCCTKTHLQNRQLQLTLSPSAGAAQWTSTTIGVTVRFSLHLPYLVYVSFLFHVRGISLYTYM